MKCKKCGHQMWQLETDAPSIIHQCFDCNVVFIDGF